MRQLIQTLDMMVPNLTPFVVNILIRSLYILFLLLFSMDKDKGFLN